MARTNEMTPAMWGSFMVPPRISGITEGRRIRPAERPPRAHRGDRLQIAVALARVLARVDEVHSAFDEFENGNVGGGTQSQGAEFIDSTDDLRRSRRGHA